MDPDNDDKASAVLRRFSAPMGLAVSQVLRDRGLEADACLRDELDQQASILVLTYAGVMRGWQAGKLAMWARLAGGDERQVKLLVTKQLKLALSQALGRRSDSRVMSLDAMLETGLDVSGDDDWEERMADRIDNRSDTARYREAYPTLAKNVFDGKTQAEIAREEHVTCRAVEYRIAKEKRAFLTAYLRRRGLSINGDETIEDLAEAYERLTARQPEAPPLGAAALPEGRRAVIYSGHTGHLDDIPQVVRDVTGELRPHKQRFDFIVATGMSGVLVGSPVAIRLHKPLVVVRKRGDDHHSYGDLINVEAARGRYLILDDFVSMGFTYRRLRQRFDMEELAGTTRYAGAYMYSDHTLSWDGDGWFRRYYGHTEPAGSLAPSSPAARFDAAMEKLRDRYGTVSFRPPSSPGV